MADQPNSGGEVKPQSQQVRYVRSVSSAPQQTAAGAAPAQQTTAPPPPPASGTGSVVPGAVPAPGAPPARRAPNLSVLQGGARSSPNMPRFADPAKKAKRLGELLLEAKVIEEDQLEHALKIHKQTNKLLGRVLVEASLIEEADLIKYLAINMGVEAVNLGAEGVINSESVLLIPEKIARRFNLICFKSEGDELHVAMAMPQDLMAVDNLKTSTGKKVRIFIATRPQIADAIDKHYAQQYSMDQMGDDLENVDAELISEAMEKKGIDQEAADAAQDAPVVKYVNATLFEAIKLRASDIHFEPFEHTVTVRFRIDGALQEFKAPPKRLFAAVTSRIKIISNLDIAERRLPQDGRCKLKVQDREIDMRVSTLPVVHGEKIVMRVLDKTATTLDINDLGFDPITLKEMKRILNSPHGVIVLTGPTGSGKTTTLYSFLKHVFTPDVNVVTVEDPVEYQLAGINQVQVKAAIGMTFAGALRSILRQDPDVVMVGEMRDKETLEVAIRAALTGHLVFSTVHTNSAVATVTRMADMGLERFMITSSLVCAISQRLIRTICSKCKEPVEMTPPLKKQLSDSFKQDVDIQLFKGKGCERCHGSGYKGRLAVHEYMTMTPKLREMVLDERPEQELEHECLRVGMRNLRQSCFMKLLDGLTTVEEAVSLFYEDF
ncbi:MAG: Flp pilus assembly complex ATPase component TadA [Planctomycetes bacterium]|nr:Flp pilus assembly complex ATPase component TadA [Planctomycetota bacterium]